MHTWSNAPYFWIWLAAYYMRCVFLEPDVLGYRWKQCTAVHSALARVAGSGKNNCRRIKMSLLMRPMLWSYFENQLVNAFRIIAKNILVLKKNKSLFEGPPISMVIDVKASWVCRTNFKMAFSLKSRSKQQTNGSKRKTNIVENGEKQDKLLIN